MTRPIKFRAWNKVEHQMHGSLTIGSIAEGSLISEVGWIEKIVLMQFTGLTDKNGTEIYEGDICKTNREELTIVEYVDDMFHLKSTKYPNLTPGNYRLAASVWSGACEVIGNVHENPELLK